MLIVDALTNNVNRTASDVRAAFGKMVVIWVYLVQWLICLTILQTFGVEGKSADDVLETLMEQDVDVRDVIEEDVDDCVCRT